MKVNLKILSKILLILGIVIALLISYLYLSTSLPYAQTSIQPVQVYFSTSQAIQLSNGGVLQKYNKIKSIDFTMKNPFGNDYSEFQIHHNNFTEEENFWFPTGNDNEEQYNRTKVDEYVASHIPDYLLQTAFIRDSPLPIWSQVWHSQPAILVATTPFFHRTSFGVWEAEYFFDDGFSGTHYENEVYLKADVEQMIFKITIPSGYYIENADKFKLEIYHNETILTQTLNSGDTFHVIIHDQNAENISRIIGFFNPMMIGILLGIMVQQIYDGMK